MENRPVGRKKNVGEGGSGVHRRGEGLGGGPVGGSGLSQHESGSSSGPNRSGGRSPLFMIIIILFLVLGGGGGLTSFLGGGLLSDDTAGQYTNTVPATTTQTTTQTQNTQSLGGFSGSGLSMLGSMLGGGGSYAGTSMQSASWSDTPNTGKLSTTVDSRARAKRTVIKGNGEDVITIIVYMCGADLESRSGMASRDIQEMLSAKLGDNINLILYTGGAKKWQNNVISSQTNQIYQIKNGQLVCLKDDLGVHRLSLQTDMI